MTLTVPGPEKPSKGNGEIRSLADELREQSERLCQLAEKLSAREEALKHKEAEHKDLVAFAYAKLREMFEPLEELPDDLEAYAAAEGAQPLEAFFAEIEVEAEGSNP